RERRRVGDRDPDELPEVRLLVPLEDRDPVLARAPREPRGVVPRAALAEDLELAAEERAVLSPLDLLLGPEEPVVALALHLVRHVVLEVPRVRRGTRRVLEDV